MSGILLGTACGDDGPGPADGGSDGSMDATTDGPGLPPDAGRRDARRDGRVDAAMDGGGARTECDPFAAGSCPDDQKCSVVFVIDEEGFAVDGYMGCVEKEIPEHGLGAPCAFSIDAAPDDDAIDAVADNCEQGLFCARQRSGGRECVRLCGNGEVDCGPGRYCAGLGLGLPGICEEATGCDPVMQQGCAASEGCYIISGTNGDVLATCFRTRLPDGGAGTTGSPCEFLSQCAAGYQCTTDRLPDGGAAEGASCRAFCRVPVTSDGGMDGGESSDAGVPEAGPADAGAADGGASDAGADAALDGGVPSDGGVGCPSPDDFCSPFVAPDGSMVRVPSRPGVCR